jgi:hypothetical protein
MRPIYLYLDFLRCIVCRLFFPPSLSVTLLQFSHVRSNWPSLLSSTTFQKFSKNFCLLSGMSNFHHHKKLCPNCRMLVVSSSKLSPVCWWKVVFLLNAWVVCKKITAAWYDNHKKHSHTLCGQKVEWTKVKSGLKVWRSPRSGYCRSECNSYAKWIPLHFSRQHVTYKALRIRYLPSTIEIFGITAMIKFSTFTKYGFYMHTCT